MLTLGRRTGLATTLGGTFSASTFTVSGGTADLANTYVYDKQDRLRRVIQTSPSSDAASAYKRVDLMYNDRGQTSTIYRQAEAAGNYNCRVRSADRIFFRVGRLVKLGD